VVSSIYQLVTSLALLSPSSTSNEVGGKGLMYVYIVSIFKADKSKGKGDASIKIILFFKLFYRGQAI